MKEDHSNILTKLLTAMLDQVSDGIVAFDKNWNYIYVNQKAAQILNRPTPAALIGKHVWTEFPESVDLPIYRSCLNALETQEVIYIEQFNPVLGRWYENRLYPSPDGIISYFTDITKRKQNEIQIREKNEQLGLALKAASVGLWDWDLKTNKVHFSSEWKHQIGHEDDEIANDFKEWESRVHPDDLAKALKTVQEFLRSPYPDYRNEFRFRHKDGTYRWILAQADLLYDEAGEPMRMLGSHIDITDRKHSETMLFKQRQQLALIYDTVADVIFYLGVEDGNNFRFISVNQAFLNSTELKSEDVVGKLIQQVIPEPSLTLVLEKYALAIRTKEIMRWEETTTYPIGTVTGEVSIAPIFDDEGHCTHLVGSVHDITTRKQAENVIKDSEERLRLSTELVNVAVWEYDLVENEMRRSTNHDSLYGLEPQDIWQIETFLNSTHPDDREMSNQIVQGAIVADGYDKYSFDFRVIWPDSSIHWLSVTGEVVQRDTNNVAQLVRGAITDITARKQSEDMLKASEQLFSTAFQVGPTGMTITRISDGKFIDANESFCQMFEYDRVEVIGRTSTELNMWTLEERQKLIQQQLETGGLHNFELVAQSKSGRSINILFSSKEMHINDEHCHLTTMIDISDRKKIENELEMSEKRFRALIEKSSDAIVLSDNQGNILYHSPSVVTLSGFTEEEYRQTAPASRIHPDDMAKFPENFKWLLEHPGETLEFESRSRHKDGTWHIMENKSRNLLHDPAVEAIITNFHDITERKQAEEALEASEHRFRTLIEKSQDFIILLDANIKPVYVSPSTLTVLGYTSEEFIQHGRAGLVHPEDTKRLGELYSQLLEYPDEALESEIRAHHKDGSWRTLRWMARNLLQDPDINAIVANLSDITERKQAEQALYESEKLFSDTFHMSPIGMVITRGTDYKIIDINETWANMLEFNRDEVIGQTSTRLNLLATAERKRAMQQLLESDELFNFEIEVQSKSGTILNMLISSKKLIIKGETCYLTTLIDVTERKQAEKALLESEEKYRTLIENASDGIFVSDSQGYYVEVNTKGCSMVGYIREELIGMHLSELVAKENLATQPLRLGELKTGKSLISERYLKHKDGTVLPVEISATMLPDGKLLGMVRDISERKEAEATILRFNERLKILRQIDLNIIAAHSSKDIADAVLNHIRKLLGAETALLSIFNEDITEVTIFSASNKSDIIFESNQSFSISDHPYRDRLQSAETILVSDLQQMDAVSDLGQQYQDAGIRTILIEALHVQTQIIGNITITSKLPDYFTSEHQEIIKEVANQLAIALNQSRLYEQLEQVNAELEQRVAERTKQLEAKNQELETFTYTVSHDLKAPLRGIDGYSRLLYEDFSESLEQEGKLFIENIQSATEQMNQLIEDLLSYSHLERRSLQANQINLQNLVTSIVQDHSLEIQKHDVTVSIVVPKMIISADLNGLNMALHNLIENAIKFRHKSRKPLIEISGTETDTVYTIWIKDNGIGFDMQYHDRIQQIFQRLHRAEDYPGTGIGLAIVQKAIARMEGRVWAESIPDVGTTFFLEIPK